ncbi:aminotransferase class V-fold PLP-dependent enzyme [Amycolatopsis nigrescens]|uniref:aminotransferase class V-fold PLP-dependent enzyme n=1 Tax=Amycolatopsis nigrescens TaxID=381445 RepID=UPI00036A3D80|nr:aminotransferase class V-fold PLP-dependent enzyme [Amycolatopsis nigrescens]
MATPKLTAAQFRDCFPPLSDSVHLASCSQGALSGELTAALAELTHDLRRHGAPWQRWMAEVERARQGVAELINASPAEIAVVSCASEGAYQVASTLDWSERPRVVTTDMEFPSIGHVWLGQSARGAEPVHLPETGAGVDAEDLLGAIDERTALVSVPIASYRNGARLPVREAVARARRLGARSFVDAYQAAGVLPVDVRELGCDYLVTGALKYLLGLPGIAFLYVRSGLTDQVPPQLTGWFGRRDPFAFDPRRLDFPAEARRFETGTPAIPAAYAANAGLRLLSRVDIRRVERHVDELAVELTGRLREAGERVWAPAGPTLGPQVALADDDPNRLADFLADRRVFAAARGQVLRFSFHYYNNSADIDALCTALADYRSLR